MRLLFCLLALFSLTPYWSFASSIQCSNSEYANQTLRFFQLGDPITGNKEILFEMDFDGQGNCNTQIKVAKTTFVFTEFGIYKGLLLLEPGKNIQLKLPPFREKSFGDEKNPYFKPVSFWFITENKDALNDKISGFEQELNRQLDKNFNRLYMQQSDSVFKSVLNQLDFAFPVNNPQAFVHHKKLKTELVRSEIFRLRPESYSKVFVTIEPDYWIHPAFSDLFEKTFQQQLSFSAKAIGGKEVSQLVHAQNLKGLLDYTNKKYKLTGKIGDLALLKMLHDAFYSNDFSKSAIKNLLGDDLFVNSSSPIVKTSARNIIEKISFMEVKSLAPEICLKQLEGKTLCTLENTDKFKYIVFADIETIVCQEHLKYLSRINELFEKHLEVFVVLRDTEREAINEFFADNEVPAYKMIDLNDSFSESYKIRSFPQCFLLDEKHAVVFNDTKSPLDGFEQQFGTWLRNELFMRQRNQSR